MFKHIQRSATVLSIIACTQALAQEGRVKLPPFTQAEINVLLFVLATAIGALIYGYYLIRKVLSEDAGTPAMRQVNQAIKEGAFAYLRRQFRTMIWFIVGITIVLILAYIPLPDYGPYIAIGIGLAFLMGVLASYSAGYVGMYAAVNGNSRVAMAALSSFKKALELAFQAGTVSGMFTVGLGLLGACIIFLIFRENAMKVLVGFGFGGCLAALFMRVGGGIYTKAADVGADLVGKVEKGIPEDDPRNAAVIADNVGDNVGDCAGMAADVFESYEVTLVAAILLGYGALSVVGEAGALKLIMYAFFIRAVGVIASVIGTWLVRGRDEEELDPMQPINVGFWSSAVVCILGFALVSFLYLRDVTNTAGEPIGWWRFFLANTMGIVLAVVTGWLTEYFTSTERRPVTEIAYSSKTGTATLILEGFATGLESTVWAIIAIAATIFSSLVIFGGDVLLSAYGISLTGLGLLATTGFILAMDTYGPISDNAHGIYEMSGALRDEAMKNERAARMVAKLDAVGNTTKALTKGFAIATAVIAAVSLFRSFTEAAGLVSAGHITGLTGRIVGISIDQPEVFIGLLIGAAVPFLFSSFAIRAVSRAAFQLIEEVRRQFRERPGIMEWKEKPDYGRCVAISTAAAQKELLGPGILAVCSPILTAFALSFMGEKVGAAALGGFLGGAIVTGQLLAVLMANAGGAWDNAKKKIEAGLFGGKGTEFHKSAVVGDTVGDPFKDTAGPSLNPLIKVMNLVGILVAPLFAQPISPLVRAIIVIVALGLLVGAIAYSKRSWVMERVEKEFAEAPAGVITPNGSNNQ
jgi:K(+)-stimulated pyrophosphate-energized sodium pump